MVDEYDSDLWLLARGYFNQDYDLLGADHDEVVRRFVHDEGPESAQGAAEEIAVLLDRPVTEDELADLWSRRYRAQFNPITKGLTYRAWFERMLEILRAGTRGSAAFS